MKIKVQLLYSLYRHNQKRRSSAALQNVAAIATPDAGFSLGPNYPEVGIRLHR
jgi:hypothetical protein